MKFRIGASLIIVFLAVFVLGRIQKHTNNFSCEQNGGPFPQIEVPSVDKSEIQKELIDFYYACLSTQYTKGYVEGSQNGNSESQAYALIQAYLADDKRAFARILSWTNSNLKRQNDSLLSWQFKVNKHSPFVFWRKPLFSDYSVQVLDTNSASDADTDFAYALLRAGRDWKNQNYIDRGKAMVSDIWNLETAEVNGRRYVVAGNWANEPERIVLNPSYFSPQAYRTFAIFDGEHDWNKLISDGYDLLAEISRQNLGPNNLPPNWVEISKADGRILAYPDKDHSRDFGYDAFRTLWRVSLDQLNSPNFQSWNYISAINVFANDWQSNNQELCALYVYQNGNYQCDRSTTGTLAGPLAAFSVTNGFLASQLVEKYYIKDGRLVLPDSDFYPRSWHWFAAWLWAHS